MGMSVEAMRAAIFDVYPGWAWKDRVRNMADNQVIAVYYSFCEKGKFDKKPKKHSEKKDKRELLPRNYFENDIAEQLSFDL